MCKTHLSGHLPVAPYEQQQIRQQAAQLREEERQNLREKQKDQKKREKEAREAAKAEGRKYQKDKSEEEIVIPNTDMYGEKFPDRETTLELLDDINQQVQALEKENAKKPWWSRKSREQLEGEILSFVRVIARFARISATLPSGFSRSCLPHNVVRHQSRPEHRLETPFSPGGSHQRPFYLAENDAAPEAASCNIRESRGQHMRQN